LDSVSFGPSLREATRRLGEALVNTEVYREYDKSRKALLSDPEAMELLGAFDTEHRRLQEIACERELSEEDIDDLTYMQKNMLSHPVVREHFSKQRHLIDMMREVNAHISALLGVDFAGYVASSNGEEGGQEREWE